VALLMVVADSEIVEACAMQGNRSMEFMSVNWPITTFVDDGCHCSGADGEVDVSLRTLSINVILSIHSIAPLHYCR